MTPRPHFRDAAGATHAGLVRRINDDAFAVDQDLGLLAVADGVGGRPAGDLAARLAIDAVRGYLASSDLTWPVEHDAVGELLGTAVAVANRCVYDTGRAAPLTEGMATTLVAALAARNGTWIAHVGDSRAFLFHNRRLERLTIDHTVGFDEQVRARLLPDELRRYSPEVLTRGIGLGETVDVELHFHAMCSGDVVLLTSDGLTKVVAEAEIAGVLVEAESLVAAVESLLGRANAYGGPDNVTVVAARWAEGEP